MPKLCQNAKILWDKNTSATHSNNAENNYTISAKVKQQIRKLWTRAQFYNLECGWISIKRTAAEW